MTCPIHGPIRGNGRGYPSSSRSPRTLEEACQGFKERNLRFFEPEEVSLVYSEEERDAIDIVLGSTSQWLRPWNGSWDHWENLRYEIEKAVSHIRSPTPSSSSISGDERAADFDPFPAWIPRRNGPPARAGRAGGHQSDMSTSHYASEPMTSDTESSGMIPYNTHPSHRDTGGNRNDGRTTRDQGGRNGNSYAGHGNSRFQGGRNAGHPPSDPRGYNTSRGPDAAHSRVQSWVHETSRHHNAGNPRAGPGSRNTGASASSGSRRGYTDASTQTW